MADAHAAHGVQQEQAAGEMAAPAGSGMTGLRGNGGEGRYGK